MDIFINGKVSIYCKILEEKFNKNRIINTICNPLYNFQCQRELLICKNKLKLREIRDETKYI